MPFKAMSIDHLCHDGARHDKAPSEVFIHMNKCTRFPSCGQAVRGAAYVPIVGDSVGVHTQLM